MKIDETIYHEYANWKLENEQLLKDLEKDGSDLLFRFKPVIDVVGYFYDKLIDDVNYSEEDDVIFKSGFYYIADQIEELKEILKNLFNNDIKEASKYFKEINLLFTTLDFQAELINNDITSEDIKSIMTFDKKVYQFLEDKKNAPSTLFEELDQLTNNIYKELNTNYYSINNIFLEIADELNIL
ncbi:MAG TPA: hypothetical protein VJ845_01120 [Haploplasma sp.]|nr:hypothetical protein [Haploplasma sp.]